MNFSFINGYIPVGGEKYSQSNTSLFFSLVTKKGERIGNFNNNTPVIFWFSGGPGCTSQYDYFGAIGSLQVLANGSLVPREFTWNDFATIIFVDNPLNTGWSYSDYPNINVSSTVEAGSFMMDFFTQFYSNNLF